METDRFEIEVKRCGLSRTRKPINWNLVNTHILYLDKKYITIRKYI